MVGQLGDFCPAKMVDSTWSNIVPKRGPKVMAMGEMGGWGDPLQLIALDWYNMLYMEVSSKNPES